MVEGWSWSEDAFQRTKLVISCKLKALRTKEMYRKILQQHVFPCGRRLEGRRLPHPCSRTTIPITVLNIARTLAKVKQKELKYMEWPPQSPDCNPIKLLRDDLDRNVRKMRPTNTKQLGTFLKTCWNKITTGSFDELVTRVSRVCLYLKRIF